MDIKQAKEILEKALLRLKSMDLSSDAAFPCGIGERPMMYRLAHYMVECGAEAEGHLKVDCDYNKHLAAVKKMLRPKSESVPGDGERSPMDSKRFFPDIVVHRRGSDCSNVLVCELKRSQDGRSRDIDRERLEILTDSSGEYHYALGAFVEIDQKHLRISVKYFERGEVVHEVTIGGE